jgi:transcriptional regulator with XRE-family HTH domain
MSISPAQCRAARALLNWTQADLEAAAKVAKKTIADFELDRRKPHDRTLDALRVALEVAGLVFIPENGDGAGVRLRKPSCEGAPN